MSIFDDYCYFVCPFKRQLGIKENVIAVRNTPMQYLAIFHGCENDNFQIKNCDIFLSFAQNIDCGYTLEPPHFKTV